MTTAIEYAEVSHNWGDGRSSVREVSFRVEPHERVALVGANGAGKTTLLLLATGLLTPASGAIRVHGTVLTRATLRAARAHVAFVFADPDDQLFCASVQDEVCFGLAQRGLDSAAQQARATEILASVGLTGLETREPLGLSLGEKKRLAIATALSTDADTLLLDEPTSGLDPRARKSLLALLGTLDRTVLYATHDLDSALSLRARVLVLDHGQLVADGSAEAILRDGPLMERHGLELPLSAGPSGA